MKHVTGNHVWWNGECSHGPLEKLERNDWLEPETPPFLALTDVVTDKHFIDSFKYYANFEHTGDIEVYNSLQGVYSPKRVFFQYTSQKLRMRLSAIDFNHHVNLPQKTNEFGELLVSRRWSKKAGRWIATKVKVPKDYSYIPYLTAVIMRERDYDRLPMTRTSLLAADDPRRIAGNIVKLPTPNSKALSAQQISRRTKKGK